MFNGPVKYEVKLSLASLPVAVYKYLVPTLSPVTDSTLKEEERLYHLCRENKGVDQLSSYSAADLPISLFRDLFCVWGNE